MPTSIEIDYVILESEYNVIMALMKYYEKEYVMECYYMEAGFDDNVTKFGNKVVNTAQRVNNAIATGGQRFDSATDRALQNAGNKIDQGLDKFSQKMNNAADKVSVTNLATKIENGINKLLSWCKKASNFIVLNTKKIPPETQVQAPQQTQQLQQEVKNYIQVSQRAVQALNQPDNQQTERERKQITAELAEIEKKMKALQIKKTLLEKQQRELTQPQNQQLPPLKFNKPQQQTSQPQQPQNQTPVQQQPSTQQQPTQQDGFLTIKAGDFQAMIKQIQEQQQKIDQSVNQSLQQANQAANNAQTATSSAKQQLMSQSVKTQATILNDCVEITKDMKRQVNGNTSYRGMTASQMLGLVADMNNKGNSQGYQHRMYVTLTGRVEFTMDVNSEFIVDEKDWKVYPNIRSLPTKTLGYENVFDCKTNRIDDNTIIVPATINKYGNILQKGVIG